MGARPLAISTNALESRVGALSLFTHRRYVPYAPLLDAPKA